MRHHQVEIPHGSPPTAEEDPVTTEGPRGHPAARGRTPGRSATIAAAAVAGLALMLSGCGIVDNVTGRSVSNVKEVEFSQELAIPPLAKSRVDAEGRRVFELTSRGIGHVDEVSIRRRGRASSSTSRSCAGRGRDPHHPPLHSRDADAIDRWTEIVPIRFCPTSYLPPPQTRPADCGAIDYPILSSRVAVSPCTSGLSTSRGGSPSRIAQCSRQCASPSPRVSP
jgi:hypothetical protein